MCASDIRKRNKNVWKTKRRQIDKGKADVYECKENFNWVFIDRTQDEMKCDMTSAVFALIQSCSEQYE